METPITTSPDLASVNLPVSKTESIPVVLSSRPMPVPTKYERPSEDFPFISPSSGSDALSSPAQSPPVTSSAASIYPFFAVDGTEPSHPAECAAWAADFKPNDFGLEALSLLSSYDGIDSGNVTTPNLPNEGASYDYRLYDSYGFNSIADQSLGPMTDHYQV